MHDLLLNYIHPNWLLWDSWWFGKAEQSWTMYLNTAFPQCLNFPTLPYLRDGNFPPSSVTWMSDKATFGWYSNRENSVSLHPMLLTVHCTFSNGSIFLVFYFYWFVEGFQLFPYICYFGWKIQLISIVNMALDQWLPHKFEKLCVPGLESPK